MATGDGGVARTVGFVSSRRAAIRAPWPLAPVLFYGGVLPRPTSSRLLPVHARFIIFYIPRGEGVYPRPHNTRKLEGGISRRKERLAGGEILRFERAPARKQRRRRPGLCARLMRSRVWIMGMEFIG